MPPGVKPNWDDNSFWIQESIVQYHIGREKEDWDVQNPKQDI